MAIKNTEAQTEFRDLYAKSGLLQIKLSTLLGVHEVTVSRWLSDRDDAVDPPWYALQFLRAFLMLDEAERASLKDKPKAR